MRLKIEIPTSIEDITLGEYQEFISQTKDDSQNELLLQTKILEVFCGITEVDGLKIEDVKNITLGISKLFLQEYELIRTFTLDGIEFGFIPNLDIMTLGEYIDLDTYMADIDELHKALSVLYRPIIKKKKAWFNRKEEQYRIEDYNGSNKWSGDMKKVPLNIALGVQFFFINLRTELLKNTVTYLEENQEVKSLIAKHNLDLNGDGTTPFMPLLREMLDL